jgi:iron complex outermembrane receptor protein
MKAVLISFVLAGVLFGSEEMKKITIEAEPNSAIVDDISKQEIKSADLADALSRHIPSINIIRRSGIANDILLRGQKRDNINVIIDGAKVCGACVNRMDPPTSHVLANNVKSVKVSEGPFDVENFGTLSGLVDIRTIKPKEELSGNINLNAGSFGYRKMAGEISGGNKKIKMLLSASTEKSDQYKDGDGDTLAMQVKKATQNTPMAKAQYQDKYFDMNAFIKSTLMGKVFLDLNQNNRLNLSYTANRSDDVLYPSSKMDALYDDSDIYNLEYIYKNISLQLYNSKVDHPMSTKYRKMGAKMEKTHHLKTDMKGAKLKGKFTLFGLDLTGGIDTSRRNWDGYFESNGVRSKMKDGKLVPKSLDDVTTKNGGLFLKAHQEYQNSKIDYGIRYDMTSIKTDRTSERDRNFYSISANIFTSTKINESLSIFGGIGNSNRVPDARELYLLMMGKHMGSPDLQESKNYEVDLGAEKIYKNFSIKIKSYYSYIKDYIAYNSSKKQNNFENVDVDIYGIELSGVAMSDLGAYLDYSLSYKRGKKRDPLTNQKGKDLADMRPLKAIVGLNYDLENTTARVEFIGATKWDKIDYENGEQKLGGYGVVNLKATQRFKKGFSLTLGVDNLFDKTYSVTNTYRDLILLTTGSKVDDVMLLNEPGRYLYANLKYEF